MNPRFTLSLLLAAALLLPFVFSSCGTPAAEQDDTAASSETRTSDTTAADTGEALFREIGDGIPDGLDLGGETVTIFSNSANSYTEVLVEDLNSDPVNDAIYNRQIAVEERLNVRFSEIRDSKDNALTRIRTEVDAGDSNFTIALTNVGTLLTVAPQGYLHDLTSLDYLTFDAPYWESSFQDAAAIRGHLFCIAGCGTLSMYRTLDCIFFNQKLADDYAGLGIRTEDLYRTVRDGGWTIDYLNTLVPLVYEDLNGNSIVDQSDRFGFVSVMTGSTGGFLTAFDIPILTRDAEGVFVLEPNTEKIASALEKVTQLYWGGSGTTTEGTAKVHFMEDRALFLLERLYITEQAEYMRSMQSDYGILPMPKYDEAQAGYHTPANNPAVFAILSTAPDPDREAAVLEALSAESYRRVIPAYADVALKGRYARDPESREMMDLIFSSLTFDSGFLYSGSLCGYPTEVFANLVEANTPDKFASVEKSTNRRAQIRLAELNGFFED